MGSKKVRLEFQTGYPNGRILGLYNSEDEAAEARDVLIQERLDTYGPDKILNQAPSDKGGRVCLVYRWILEPPRGLLELPKSERFSGWASVGMIP